jgi:hypothetical protein
MRIGSPVLHCTGVANCLSLYIYTYLGISCFPTDNDNRETKRRLVGMNCTDVLDISLVPIIFWCMHYM